MNTTRPETFWTDDRVEELRTLWADGLSASQIARAMGAPSRNSVLSKVHRSGFAGRAVTNRTLPRRTTAAHLPRVTRAPAPPPVIEMPPLVFEDGSHVTSLTIGDRFCRWPIGDPASADFCFCGNEPAAGKPYCDAHWRRGHNPPQQKRGQHTGEAA